MSDLEADLESLQELDVIRIRCAELRDEGVKILLRRGLKRDDPIPEIVRAVASARGPLPALALRYLRRLRLKDVQPLRLSTVGPFSSMPVLESALALQALLRFPGATFAPSMPALLYVIIREIYSVDAPDWTVGGARASESGQVSAFVTGECLRALGALARNLARTGDFFEAVGHTVERLGRLGTLRVPKDWAEAEAQRLMLSFYVTARDARRFLAVDLGSLNTLRQASRFLSTSRAVTERSLVGAHRALQRANLAVTAHRALEKRRARAKQEPRRRFDRSAAAHDIAAETIHRAAERAKKARECVRDRSTPDWQALAQLFRDAARDVSRVFRPAQRFLGTVIDRELASASAEREWDAGELACAAAALGLVTDGWDDERLGRAGTFLCRAISERGRFPSGRPFHAIAGSMYQITTVQIVRNLAQLLRHTADAPLAPRLARRLLAVFLETAVPRSAHLKLEGWAHEDAGEVTQPSSWITAEATLALAGLNKALDEHINTSVFRHFAVKTWRELGQGPSLDALFYGDYGFRVAPVHIRRDSVALALEEARGHVLGLTQEGNWPLRHSLVLYGPPGTGKTTLIEALAASSRSTLVQVTPSDIVVGGADAIERRTRAVFSALSLLTRSVVLFDEFDPVVWRRSERAPEPRSVFAFLTPGMLPKLKSLYRAARRRRVVFALITNMIGNLDEAAVRAGRFDYRAGLFPPDPLSRVGRLVSEFEGRQKRLASSVWRGRLKRLVEASAGAAMERLGQPGWFTWVQNGVAVRNCLQAYLCEPRRRIPSFPERDATLPDAPRGRSPAGIREWQEWQWICEWDATVANSADLEHAMRDHPRRLRRPPVAPANKGNEK